MKQLRYSVTHPAPDPAAPGTVILPHSLTHLPEMAWVSAADGSAAAFNARWLSVTGAEAADWTQLAHADDRAAVQARWQASLADGSPFEARFRLRRADGSHLWVLARAVLVDDDGPVWLGTATDIDALKASEDHATLVAGELAHRLGNVFGVIGGVLALSARERPEAADFARSTGARIEALSKAHGYILGAQTNSEASPQRLHGLLDALLRPYQSVGGPLVEISGDDIEISGSAVTSVALVVHELATNAVKYGALSLPSGCLAIRVRKTARHVTIIWSETGGPTIANSPTRHGFGTTLIDRVMKMGNGARARRWWRPDGLAVAMRLDVEG